MNTAALFLFFIGLLTSAALATPLLYSLFQRVRVAERAASTDVLTGLPNRQAFFSQAAGLVRTLASAGQSVAIGLLDLNGFKRINDEWGHDVGDWALVRIAQSLRAAVADQGIVARLGGDEFAIVLAPPSEVQDGAWIGKAAEQMCEAVAEPLILIGYQLPQVTASLGLQVVTDPTISVAQCLHEADVAMYYTKRGMRAGFTVYDRSKMPDPLPSTRMQRPPIRVRECSVDAST